MEIKGKRAIITGATGELASQIVLSLAREGIYCVCIYNQNLAKAKMLNRKLGAKCLFVQMDLTVPENIDKFFIDIQKLPVPQILINAASIFHKKSIENINYEYIRQTLDINFAAAMLMTKKFVEFVRRKILRLRRGFGGQGQKQNLSSTAIGEPIGKIINFADMTAQKPPAGFSVYCASKAALIAATKSFAKELAPDFTVNAVAPGIMTWPKNITPELKKKILSHIPAGREGCPDEVAQAVKFLIENDYVTGQVINVDGGRSL